MLKRLSRLIPDISLTLARFPIPALISLALCVYANLDAAGYLGDRAEMPDRVYFAGAAAFLAAGAAHYHALGRNIGRGADLLLALGAAAIVAAAVYFGENTRISTEFLFAGLLPLLMIAGFLRPGASQAALWLFNLRLGLAALLAVIVALVFAGGLSAIVESLNFLFEAGLPHSLHSHIWATAMSLVAPLYGLSLAPRDLAEEVRIGDHRDTLLERGVSILVNYVLVPIALIYALILHAYAIKILLDGTLPKNQIGPMVTIYALGGTGAWLIAWPWRDSGSALLRWFMRGWFWLTIVPAVLLVIAVWERISAYGVTPDRYGLVVVAVWLAVVTLYLAIRRNRADMRLLLGSFAVLVLIGAGGPWGANGVTIVDQFARLTGLLSDNKVVDANGHIADPVPAIPDQAKRDINSIIQTLSEVGGLDRLRPFFADRADNPFDKDQSRWELTNAIATLLKLNEWNSPPSYVSFTANRPITQNLTGAGKLIGPIRGLNSIDPAATLLPSAVVGDQSLTITLADRSLIVPVKTLFEGVGSAGADGNKEPLVVAATPNADLIIVELYGDAGEKPILRGGTFWLVIRD